MSLQSTPAVLAFARYFNRPCCAQCGDVQLVPEHSEFAGEARVRHIWACDGCGFEFETSFEFVAP